MADLLDGVVTFVFTDIQGSTRMWEESPELMMRALAQHDEVIDAAIAANDGLSVKPRGEGDSRFLVFDDACAALRAMAEVQAGLTTVDWVTPTPIRVRASLHTGTADRQLGDYYGPTVNRAARLRAIAHGGQTILSRSTYELVREQLPDGCSVRDMGEHGLKDLTRPEHVYQLCIAGLPDEFPPLASIDAVPNNLPIQLTELVGRQNELADAERLLEQTRLLTILAPGGTGKTRLAIQVAAELVADFPDGVYFISLADITLSRDIVRAVAESLGLALSSDEDTKTQLLTYLAPKRQLLVFDNFEHLIDEAPIVTTILQAAPGVKAIATSRTKLRVTGETAFTLGGLETTWSVPGEAFHTSGVQLFLDAAKRARPGFGLESSDLEALGAILQITDGLPLAILLAAAWVDMLSVAEIAAEIEKNMDFLETELGDVPERHRSIRAVFDYSLALLEPDERDTFTALSVFRGGFTREAAEAVSGASLRTLANLINKSLVTASPETGRYAVHELLRQYAEGELAKDRKTAQRVTQAHAAFYAGLMQKSLRLFAETDQRRLFAMLEDDLDNVRSAWRHYLGAGDAAQARKFVEGLLYLHEIRGWYPIAIGLFGEALDALDPSSEDPDVIKLRALAEAVQAWFMALMGRPDAGVTAAEAATKMLRDTDDLVGYMTAAQCWAISLAYLGRMEEMAACMETAMEVAYANGQAFWSAAMQNWRAFCAFLTGDIATAQTLLPQAYAVFDARDEHYFMSWNLWLQAMIATTHGHTEEAIDLYTRQVGVCRGIKYMRGSTVALEGLGDANLAAGRFEAAERAFVDGIASADKMGMVRDMLGMMTKVATVRGAMDRPAEAVQMLATVLADPSSALQPFSSNTPIRDRAAEVLEALRDTLDADVYAKAVARGEATSFEVAAKDLMGGVVEPARV